jgi:esterase
MFKKSQSLAHDIFPCENETCFGDVLICHGLLGSRKNWKSFSQKLSTHCNVYSVDLRNHGDSFHGEVESYSDLADDIVQFCKEQKISKAFFLGHSAGGKVVLNLGLRHSEVSRGLVIVDSSPFPTLRTLPVIEALNRLQPISVDTYEDAVAQFKSVGIDENIGRWLCGNLYRAGNKKLEWKINLPELLRITPNLLAESMPSGVNIDPVLFINSSKTNILPEIQYAEVRKKFPKASFEIWEHVGHNIHMDDPEKLLEQVIGFLKSY